MDKRVPKKVDDFLKEPLAPFSKRIMALIGDYCLGYFIFYYLLSFEHVSSIYASFKKSLEFVGFLEGLSTDFLATLVLTYLLTHIFRFYFSLIFKVSLFQKLLGIGAVGEGFFLSRVASGSRVFFEFLFSPLCLSLILTFFSRPSFPELLTSTRLIFKPSLLTRLTSFFIPFLLAFSFLSPMLQHLTFIDGVKVGFTKQVKSKLEKGRDFSDFLLFSSNRFHFSTLSDLDKGRFMIFPTYEIHKLGSEMKTKPLVLFYDQEKKVYADLKIKKVVGLLDILKQSKTGNPYFSETFSELDRILESPRKNYERRNFVDSDEPLINPLGREQMREAIQASFELSLKNMFWHVYERGPFLRGFVLLRNSLLSLVDSTVAPEVDFLELGDVTFFRMKQIYSRDRLAEGTYKETLIPVHSHYAPVYEFTWDKTLNSAVSRKMFYRSFFSASEWFFDYRGVFSFPDEDNQLSSFDVIDFLGREDLSNQQKKRLEEFIFKKFFNVARVSFENNDDNLKEILPGVLSRFFLIIQMKNKETKDYFSLKLKNQLIELKEAIESNNRDYFDL